MQVFLLLGDIVGYYWGEVIGDVSFDERQIIGRNKMILTNFELSKGITIVIII